MRRTVSLRTLATVCEMFEVEEVVADLIHGLLELYGPPVSEGFADVYVGEEGSVDDCIAALTGESQLPENAAENLRRIWRERSPQYVKPALIVVGMPYPPTGPVGAPAHVTTYTEEAARVARQRRALTPPTSQQARRN